MHFLQQVCKWENLFHCNFCDKVGGVSTYPVLKPLFEDALVEHLNHMDQKPICDKDSCKEAVKFRYRWHHAECILEIKDKRYSQNDAINKCGDGNNRKRGLWLDKWNFSCLKEMDNENLMWCNCRTLVRIKDLLYVSRGCRILPES